MDTSKLADEVPKVFTKNFPEYLTTTKVKSTNPVDKGKIPWEWRHNATYPENFILRKPDEKLR